jgi:hypothetical protein
MTIPSRGVGRGYAARTGCLGCSLTRDLEIRRIYSGRYRYIQGNSSYLDRSITHFCAGSEA